MVIGGVEDIM